MIKLSKMKFRSPCFSFWKITSIGWPFVWLCTLLILFTTSCADKPVKESQIPKPNIIYILADDLGYGDPGCYNSNSGIRTPHIDWLAKEGMRFTDMHSGSSVCTPTRYGILTGRYSWRTRLKSGVLDGLDPPLIEPGDLTVAEVLREAGYHTACIGKWHLGLDFVKVDPTKPAYQGSFWEGISELNVDYSKGITDGPTDHGFDYSYIIPSSLDIQPYFYIKNHDILGLPMDTTLGNNQGTTKGPFWRPGDKASTFDFEKALMHLMAQSIIYLNQRAQSNQPFFLYFPLTAPHTPWLPSEPYLNTSSAGMYGDFVGQVDAVVGRLMEELEVLNLDQNTLVIFTSDNGAYWNREDITTYRHRANGDFRGQKADIWEGGHSIPFVARWPGQINAGSTSNITACLTDFMATVADLQGQTLSSEVAKDSYSLLPTLLGQTDRPYRRAPVIHHSLDGKFAIRKSKWKFIPSRGSGGFTEPKDYKPSEDEPAGQLYDLLSDIGEQKNLYLDFPEVVADLEAELARIKNQ